MPWYAIHTKSRHEDKVLLGLTQKSIHAFLPKMEVWSKRQDRRKKIHIPMFSGYLFAETAEMGNRTRLDILKTAGVVRILGRPNSQDPIPVPDDKIDAIQRLVASAWRSSRSSIRRWESGPASSTARSGASRASS
jgi:transcription antitermination factor NusG